MLIYADGYSIAVNNDKSNIMINFLQSTPHIDPDNGNIESIIQEPVAGITMNVDKAADLANTLIQLLREE